MWVDAICIDQGDIPERNEQTAKMREIYQNAEGVAVWLGGEYNASAEAINFARDVVACTSTTEVEDLLEDHEQELRALVTLFRRQYWWRIWVIQEVTCGRKVMVYCGDEAVEWDILDVACEVFKDHESYLKKILYKHHTYIRTLVAGGPKGLQLSRYSPGNPAPPLLELLISHKSKKSTEPRDKVFALVGISSSRHDFGEIDYSQSIRKIFSHTARLLIKESQRLDVICLKQTDRPEYNLPSWAPNWVRNYTKDRSALVGLHHCETFFQADSGSSADVTFHGDGKFIMRARGVELDIISAVSEPFMKRGSPADPIPPLRAFLNWWDLFESKFPDSPTSLALFGRVLSCGNWKFDNEEDYISKLDSLFTLAEDMLDDPRLYQQHGSNPVSRSSTLSLSRSSTARSFTTMSNSSYSLPDEEDDEALTLDTEERERLGTILGASALMNRRRLIVTENGRAGLGFWNAEVGDVVAVLLGCRFPVILRPVDGHYVLIGEAYVDGLMGGEALDGVKDGRHGWETFEIW
jgi:hypothetical protein